MSDGSCGLCTPDVSDGDADGQSDGAGLAESDGQFVPDGSGEGEPPGELDVAVAGSVGAGVEAALLDGVGCADVAVGDGLGPSFGSPPPGPMPTGGPGSTGGSDGLCLGRPWCLSGVVGSTGTVIPTAPLAYTFSRPITVAT